MIKIGSAGFNENIAEFLKNNNMHCAEVEFVRGIYLKDENKISKLKSIAKKNKIQLSVHAPYYINLASLDKDKITASKKRIIHSAVVGDMLGAKYVCFHPGFYHKRNKKEVYEIIKNNIIEIHDKLKENGYKIKLAPELMGKVSQFGDAEEITQLNKEINGISMTIDFAHYLARYQEKTNYKKLINQLPKSFHAHFSGIEYNEKGEKRHIPIQISVFEKILKELIKEKKDVSIINESPNVFTDLIKMNKALKKLQPD